MTLDVTEGAPDPKDAALCFERIAGAFEAAGIEPPWARGATSDPVAGPSDPGGAIAAHAVRVLALACRRAPYLAALLLRDPRRLDRVARDPYLHREKPRPAMADELARVLAGCPEDDPDELAARLRRYRGDEMVRLGARELELGNPVEVGRELAHLADASFDAAIGFHDRALRREHGPPRYQGDDGGLRDAELVVIGMGKLGGLELNFSSDVDVIYFYSSDAGGAGDLSLHEYYSKLCRRVTRAIADVTADEFVFRVDLRLRPEGSQGAIANSLPSGERYYETWGRPWERQAWLKARPCAGSMELGAEVMRTLRPFVYPRTTSRAVIDDVTELNRRIKIELLRPLAGRASAAPGQGPEHAGDGAGVGPGFDVKNGVGGIREVEFFVQALQLVHGGHNPKVRSRSTLVALSQLLFAGLVSEREHRLLTQAYRYLRRTEHLLQLDSGRQTQRLPAGDHALEVLARRLGHADRAEFLALLSEHARHVAALFATLATGDGDGGAAGDDRSRVPDDDRSRAIAGLLSGALDEAGEVAVLSQLGFRDPGHARHELVIARRKPMSPLGDRATGVVARLAPELMAEIVASPDPDQALAYTSDLISRRGSWSPLWRLFAEVPATLRLTVSLFGTSSFLAKTFVDNPELIDVLVDIGRSGAVRAREQLDAELDAGARDIDDPERLWDCLARFKNQQVLRIGLADIAGELEPDEVSTELSLLAEVCLARAFALVEWAMVARHGIARSADRGEPAPLAILALGKLGSRELGYASDLDLIFVYAADGESDGPRPLDNRTYMTRLAQRLMGGLHAMHPGGRLYQVDTRLRPSGSKGLLVSTVSAWLAYHQGEARLWERQALIRLRPVAGDVELGRRVARAAASHVYGASPGEGGREDRPAIAAGIRAMRDEIERQLAGPRGADDLKAGRGGLIDVEFASQYLQLAHGHDHPELRTRSTVASLERAAALGLADAVACSVLSDGYRFLRKLENRMRIVHDRSVHTLPGDRDELDKLARRAGYPDGAALTEDCRRWTREIRAAYLRIVEPAA